MGTDAIEFALAELLEIVRSAIEMGDWKVDAQSDPEVALQRAEQGLRNRGWIQNGVDESWMAP